MGNRPPTLSIILHYKWTWRKVGCQKFLLENWKLKNNFEIILKQKKIKFPTKHWNFFHCKYFWRNYFQHLPSAQETFFNLIRHQSNLPWKLMSFFLVFFLLKMQNLNLFSSTWNPVVNYSLGNYFSFGENKVFSSKFFSNPIFFHYCTSYKL